MNKNILYVIVSIMIGCLIGQLDLMDYISILFLFIIFFVVGLITLFVMLILNKKEGVTMSGSMTMLTFSVIIVSFITTLVKTSIRVERGEKIVSKLNEYQRKNGAFPEHFHDAGLAYSEDIYYYESDSTKNTFFLSFSMDGWSRKEYSSETKEWVEVE